MRQRDTPLTMAAPSRQPQPVVGPGVNCIARKSKYIPRVVPFIIDYEIPEPTPWEPWHPPTLIELPEIEVYVLRVSNFHESPASGVTKTVAGNFEIQWGPPQSTFEKWIIPVATVGAVCILAGSVRNTRFIPRGTGWIYGLPSQ